MSPFQGWVHVCRSRPGASLRCAPGWHRAAHSGRRGGIPAGWPGLEALRKARKSGHVTPVPVRAIRCAAASATLSGECPRLRVAPATEDAVKRGGPAVPRDLVPPDKLQTAVVLQMRLFFSERTKMDPGKPSAVRQETISHGTVRGSPGADTARLAWDSIHPAFSIVLLKRKTPREDCSWRGV